MTEEQQIRLEARCQNWGRWSRGGRGGASTCGSAEGRYVGPRDDGDARADRLAVEQLDPLDAEVIEKAVCMLRVERARLLLRMVYVQRKDKLSLARWLNVGTVLVRPAIVMALGALQARLERMPIRTRDSDRMKRGLHLSSRSDSVRVVPTSDSAKSGQQS